MMPGNRAVYSGIHAGLRLVVGCVFFYAGYVKFQSPISFLENIYAYEVLGPKLSLAVAFFLPAAEVVVGFCLLAGLLLNAGWPVALNLGTAFLITQWLAIRRGLEVPCGCFGIGSAQSEFVGLSTIVRAGVICALALLGNIAYFGKGLCPENRSKPGAPESNTDPTTLLGGVPCKSS